MSEKVLTSGRMAYLLVTIAILMSTRAFLDPIIDQVLIISTLLALSCWAVYSRKIELAAFLFITLMVMWIFLGTFISGGFQFTTVVGHFLRIIFALCIISVVGKRYFAIFPNVVFFFSLMGLPIFLFGLYSPNLIEEIYKLAPWWSRINTSDQSTYQFIDQWRRASLGFYVLSPDRPFQNHGFMWEPAAFSLMTVSALMVRIGLEKTRLDFVNSTLVLSSISTFSTTGYIALSVVITIWLFLKGSIGRIFLVILLPVLGLIAYNLSFIFPKIITEFYAGYSANTTWALSRYASFVRDMEEFYTAPFIGVGLFTDARPHFNAQLPSNNGLSDYLVRYGLFWFIAIFLMLYRSMRLAGGRMLASLGLVLVFLIFGWSEKFFELPFFLVFQLYALWKSSEPRSNLTAQL